MVLTFKTVNLLSIDLQMSMVSHKTVRLALTTGDPIDLTKIAKKESMDNVERWIVSISHTVRMIDFHQQEYRMLHERHLQSTSTTFCRHQLRPIVSAILTFVSYFPLLYPQL